MTTRCLSVEEIARLGTADARDPQRRHVDSCARCAALAVEYAEFVRAQPGEGADVGDAARHLSAFVAERIVREPASAATQRPPRRRFDLSYRRLLLMAASAAAAVVLVVVVARWQSTPDEVRLRGEGVALQLEPYTVAVDGTVVLSWSAVPGADGYRVQILGADLSERAVLAPAVGTTAVLSPAILALERGTYYWEVTALAAGDAIVSSAPAPLRVE